MVWEDIRCLNKLVPVHVRVRGRCYLISFGTKYGDDVTLRAGRQAGSLDMMQRCQRKQYVTIDKKKKVP